MPQTAMNNHVAELTHYQDPQAKADQLREAS
jgi:hypothetical protein